MFCCIIATVLYRCQPLTVGEWGNVLVEWRTASVDIDCELG